MRKIIEFFSKDNNNIEQNLKKYAKKEETKQQESKIHGQKPVKGKTNKEKSTVQ
jgi:hypothetical protein